MTGGVSPDEFSRELKKLTSSQPHLRPSRQELTHRLEEIVSRNAAQVSKFTGKEFATAINGLEMLLDKLSKAAKTLNPQDEARAQIEQEISMIMSLKGDLIRSHKELGRVDI